VTVSSTAGKPQRDARARERRAVLHYLWPQLAHGRSLPAAAEPTADELRWSVRGELRTRETFGLPHPADYRGGPVPWLPVPPLDQ